jgi:hypothetical protein
MINNAIESSNIPQLILFRALLYLRQKLYYESLKDFGVFYDKNDRGGEYGHPDAYYFDNLFSLVTDSQLKVFFSTNYHLYSPNCSLFLDYFLSLTLTLLWSHTFQDLSLHSSILGRMILFHLEEKEELVRIEKEGNERKERGERVCLVNLYEHPFVPFSHLQFAFSLFFFLSFSLLFSS